MDVNIVSGVRHYKEGGYLSKDTLYSSANSTITMLDFKALGFFLQLRDIPIPKIGHYLADQGAYFGGHYHYSHVTFQSSGGELTVDIPRKKLPPGYTYIPNEESELAEPKS